jgi:GH25 family lysozyme M1 (1,4-beta-N-acetylmuramidase)
MITIKLPACYDISHWKEVPDFNAVSPRPLLFITKATEAAPNTGWNHTDDKFIRFFAGMKQIGVHRGAYHFFRRTVDAVKQAEHFCRVIYPHVHSGDILILDVEEGGETASQLWAWFEAVRKQYPNNLLMIYSRANILNAIRMTEGEKAYFKKIPSWTAGYPDSPHLWDFPPSGYIPDPSKWGSVWLWQYSAHGAVTGIDGDVDLNWMDPELIEYLGGTTPPPVEPGETMKGKVIKLTNIRQSNTQFSADMGDLLAGDLVEWIEEGTGSDGLVWIKMISATHNGAPVRCSDGNTVAGRYCWAANVEEINPPPAEEFPARVGLTIGSETRYYVPE